MRQFFHRLSCWWFAIMTPTYAPLTTIYQRETMRKRRLLSFVALLHLPLTLSCIPLGTVLELNALQTSLIYALFFAILLTLWINQRGFLNGAGLFYIFSSSSIEILFIKCISYNIPILSLCVWPMLLIAVVTTGLFLPAWGPLLLGVITTAFLCWFMLIGGHQQIAIYITNLHIQLVVLIFSCIVTIGVTIYSALFAVTTNKAVIGADRAIELEQAHQALAAAYTNAEITNKKLEIALASIQKQALTDAMTDLPNHRAVIEQLEREMNRAQRDNNAFSLLFFDVDHFKHINDTYGHAAGDMVLRQIGERVSTILRLEDTLGRFGGEEFVVLLPDTDVDAAYAIAERIRTVVAAKPVATSQIADGIPVTVSIGLSTRTMCDTTGEELLSQADEAMYIAKRLGRNQVRTLDEARNVYKDAERMALIQQKEQLEAMQL